MTSIDSASRRASVTNSTVIASPLWCRPTSFLPRSVIIVAPTSRSIRASFRPEIDVAGESTRVLVEQINAVDARRLGDLLVHVTPEELWGIDEALATLLGLD